MAEALESPRGYAAAGGQPGLVGEHHELCAVVRVELHHRAAHVGFRGGGTDHQPLGYLGVGQAVSHERHHLALARSQLVELGRC